MRIVMIYLFTFSLDLSRVFSLFRCEIISLNSSLSLALTSSLTGSVTYVARLPHQGVMRGQREVSLPIMIKISLPEYVCFDDALILTPSLRPDNRSRRLKILSWSTRNLFVIFKRAVDIWIERGEKKRMWNRYVDCKWINIQIGR